MHGALTRTRGFELAGGHEHPRGMSVVGMRARRDRHDRPARRRPHRLPRAPLRIRVSETRCERGGDAPPAPVDPLDDPVGRAERAHVAVREAALSAHRTLDVTRRDVEFG
jgi:hypothetical protein